MKLGFKKINEILSLFKMSYFDLEKATIVSDKLEFFTIANNIVARWLLLHSHTLLEQE